MATNNKLVSINFFEITNEQMQNIVHNFKRLYPNETNMIWSNVNLLLNIINDYKSSLKQDTQVNIEFMPIAYDPVLALHYIKRVFTSYDGSKQEYIDYYNSTGKYTFNENSSDEELAKAIIDRISIGFTLKNNENNVQRHYDMGRLCPPNCPD